MEKETTEAIKEVFAIPQGQDVVILEMKGIEKRCPADCATCPSVVREQCFPLITEIQRIAWRKLVNKLIGGKR